MHARSMLDLLSYWSKCALHTFGSWGNLKKKILSLELHEATLVCNEKKGKQSTVLISSLKLL